MPISFWKLAPPSLVATSFYDTLLPIVSLPLPSKVTLCMGVGRRQGLYLMEQCMEIKYLRAGEFFLF